MNCPKCGNVNFEGASFCSKCGAQLTQTSQFLIVTTPTVAGYKIKKVLGLVTGLTPRTRGIFGQFMAGFESMVGGEVTAFTSEVEKARWEAIERAKNRALAPWRKRNHRHGCRNLRHGRSKRDYAFLRNWNSGNNRP
jgi:hypothetical protein